jgi:hypothetical protein
MLGGADFLPSSGDALMLKDVTFQTKRLMRGNPLPSGGDVLALKAVTFQTKCLTGKSSPKSRRAGHASENEMYERIAIIIHGKT